MTWPVGSQYADLTGKGSLVGIADEILNINKLNRQKRDSAQRIRLMRTVEMREYKRESRARPTKRMTEAMRDIVKYITKKPGAQRRELLEKALGGHIISPSSLGGSLKALVDQKIITGNGRTTNRKFYLAGESFD
jgi:hypothetical protein